jgi:hypothetical protein
VVIHYLLEKNTGMRIRNSIYVDKSQWVAEKGSKEVSKRGETDLDFEQARIARHLGDRGSDLKREDFKKVTKDDYEEIASSTTS